MAFRGFLGGLIFERSDSQAVIKREFFMFAVFAKVAGITTLAMGLAAAQSDTINVLTPYEKDQGFVLMFDSTAASFRTNFTQYGQNDSTSINALTYWVMDSTTNPSTTGTYTPRDVDKPGEFFRVMRNTTNANDTRTRKKYRNMDLRLEYRNDGNAGIIYRSDVSQGNAWGTGVEFAIDNNTAQRGWITAGAAYEMYAPTPTAAVGYRPWNAGNGRWNTVRLVVKNDSVEHWFNGVKIVSFRYWSQSFTDSAAKSKWAGYPRYCATANNNKQYMQTGYWTFQLDHSGRWQIRKLRVLHDSLTTMNRVKFGPIDTTRTPISVLPGTRTGSALEYSIESLANGLRISMDAKNTLYFAEVFGMDGRLARRVEAQHANSLVLDKNGMQAGTYVLRLSTSSGVYQEKISVR
jgi:hypothetical protein